VGKPATQVLDLLKNSHMKEASESIYTVVHSFSAMECGSSQSTKWEDKAGHRRCGKLLCLKYYIRTKSHCSARDFDSYGGAPGGGCTSALGWGCVVRRDNRGGPWMEGQAWNRC
jgi:hypothetical protein